MSSTEEVINPVRCPKCDAEVRDGSLFCYNCGSRISENDSVETADETPVAPAEPVTRPAPGLRSARDIKRRERGGGRKPKEVVWEPVSGFPEIQLVIVTVVIIVFTVGVILMALYLH